MYWELVLFTSQFEAVIFTFSEVVRLFQWKNYIQNYCVMPDFIIYCVPYVDRQWWHSIFCAVFIDILEEKGFFILAHSSHVSPGKTGKSFRVMNILTCQTFGAYSAPRQWSGFSPPQNEILYYLHIYNSTFPVVFWKSANHIWCTVLDLKWQHFIMHSQTPHFPFSPRMKSQNLWLICKSLQ